VQPRDGNAKNRFAIFQARATLSSAGE
jgi:hypothetical protein